MINGATREDSGGRADQRAYANSIPDALMRENAGRHGRPIMDARMMPIRWCPVRTIAWRATGHANRYYQALTMRRDLRKPPSCPCLFARMTRDIKLNDRLIIGGGPVFAAHRAHPADNHGANRIPLRQTLMWPPGSTMPFSPLVCSVC